MKSKIINRLILVILTILILYGMYFGIFIFPKIIKIRNISNLENIVSEHKISLISIRLSMMELPRLSIEDQDLAILKDYHMNNIKSLTDKILLKNEKLKGDDWEKLKNLSLEVSISIPSVYKDLEDFDRIYGKIFQYSPVDDLGTDFQDKNFNSLVLKTQNSIDFFTKVINDNPQNQDINSEIEKNISILKKINSKAYNEKGDLELYDYIITHEENISRLKSKLLVYYHTILRSDKSVVSLKDLSNLIILEENYLTKLESQKQDLIKSLAR